MTATARLADADRRLSDVFGVRLEREHPLAPMTTYRVGGAATWFVAVRSADDLLAVADVRRATGVPVLLVGRGSNMLVSDAGFGGVAVSVAEFADQIEIPDVVGVAAGEPVEVIAGGGAALPVVARRTAGAGVRGFEWAVGVPGSIGGAVRMNAGGHGSDMAAALVDVGVLDFDQPEHGTFRIPAEQIGLRFRAVLAGSVARGPRRQARAPDG